MKNKISLEEFKQYVISEAKKLYQIEVLKEEKNKIQLQLMEWDKNAIKAAKKDIESDGQKFEPIGKNKFEKNIDKKGLHKAMSPESEKQLDEKKYSDKASNFIGKEIGHLQKDKDYPHDRAVAAAINIAKDKGYKIPAKNESAPSAGLSAEKKSTIVKKAKAGEDIGHKGKGFEKVANKAAKEYGSKEAGERVAAASMWKNAHR